MIATSTITIGLGAATATSTIGGGVLFARQNKKIKKLEAAQARNEIKMLGLAGGTLLLIGAQISDEFSRSKQIKLIGDRLTAVEAAVNAINSRPPAYVIQPSVPTTPIGK